MKEKGSFRGFLIFFDHDGLPDDICYDLSTKEKEERLNTMLENSRKAGRERQKTNVPKTKPRILVLKALKDKSGPGRTVVAKFPGIDVGSPCARDTFAKGGISLNQSAKRNSCYDFIGTGKGVLWKDVLWLKRCSLVDYDNTPEPDNELRRKIWDDIIADDESGRATYYVRDQDGKLINNEEPFSSVGDIRKHLNGAKYGHARISILYKELNKKGLGVKKGNKQSKWEDKVSALKGEAKWEAPNGKTYTIKAT